MPEYSAREAFRGLEDFSHIWLIWQFSESANKKWHPTVRPPRLGGNMRKGVFATRSPFRPSPIGLSCVKLERIEFTGGIVGIVDVAPELEGAAEFIRQAREFCTVSLAHTDGDYEAASAAFEAGATHLTHLFNAMTGIHHNCICHREILFCLFYASIPPSVPAPAQIIKEVRTLVPRITFDWFVISDIANNTRK